MHQQEQESFTEKLQKGYCRLTHELLKNAKVNEITFGFLMLIETFQIIHFSLRDQIRDDWSSPVIKYIQLILNFISVDYLIAETPAIFTSLLIGLLLLMTLALVFMGMMAWIMSSRKKLPPLLKSLLPLLIFLLYLFKTVLQIPVIELILISFVGNLRQNLGVEGSETVCIVGGVLNLLAFLTIQGYLATSFKECNPFSEVIHCGESFNKSVVAICYKTVLCMVLALDYNNEMGINLLIINTCVCTAYLAYQHLELGYYKEGVRVLSLKLHYLGLTFFLMATLSFIEINDEDTVVFFLIACYAMFYQICEYIERGLSLQSIERQMIEIKNESQLDEHVINLIRYIDTIEKRESKIVLEGYLAYHCRQCKIGEGNCHCRVLSNVSDRSADQKTEFYKFLIDILRDNLNRFTDAKNIHLMLSFIYQYRLKNRFQSIYSITRTLKKNSLTNRLYFYHQINLIEGEMVEDDNKESSNKNVDVNRFFQYNNIMVHFEQMLEKCTRNHISFWKELLEINTDIKRLEKAGTLVTDSKEEIREEFERMLTINPDNVHTLTIYGRFLIEVANEESSNVKFLDKAESILKNLKESSKIEDNNSNKYTDNAETTVVVISGNEGELGLISHTNNYILKMLGYKRSECLGININAVMPKIFGQSHNQVLERYLSTSSDRCNGKERVVPALAKDGYMVPVVALTKPLPDLEKGIQIVGFLSKLEEQPEEEEINREYFYLLYRSDNEQVVGITNNCYRDFQIPCCLIYGNPYNNNNELKIKNLFGFSFDKDKEGQVAAALETSEVILTINTTRLSEDFIISKGSESENVKDEPLDLDSNDFGVTVKVVVRSILSYNYRGTPLKLLSIYKQGEDQYQDKQLAMTSRSKNDEITKYMQKTESSDLKDLKDFKNFISIKSEPSAISIINNICCLLMLVIASCIGVFIWIWISTKGENENILSATHKGLRNEIVVPKMLFELQKLYMNRDSSLGLSQSYNETEVRNDLTDMIQMIKVNERTFLPLKFAFIENYDYQISEFQVDTQGALSEEQALIDEVITLYISKVDTLLDSDISDLYTQPTNYSSSPFLMYLEIKYNEIFSIREHSSLDIQIVIDSYIEEVEFYIIIFYVLSAIMFLAVVLWLFTSIPYVLSVSKINNRVLSLFSLIPATDIDKLIARSFYYMKKHLTEAVVSDEELDNLQECQLEETQNQNNESVLNQSALQSPVSFLNPRQKLPTAKKNNSAVNGSAIDIDEKFSKMVNSENEEKNMTILQFLVVSLLLIGYILFNHFYAVGVVRGTEQQVVNLRYLSQRIAILTNVKLLVTEYLMDSSLQIRSDLPSILTLNEKIIEESFAIERVLLNIDLGDQAQSLIDYNSGNLCSYISEYENFALFETSFSEAECLSLSDGILAKGIKATIVNILEEVRTIISMNSTALAADRTNLLEQKTEEYDLLLKYLQNPMLKIIGGTEASVDQSNELYQTVLIVCSSIFLFLIVAFWRIIWKVYIGDLNNKIWRTKGMLNLIPMRIITANESLKNQFASGQLEKAVR